MSNPIYLAESSSRLGTGSHVITAIPAKVVSLAADRCAVFFDSDHLELEKGERLSVSVGGTPQRTPLMILRLSMGDAGHRSVILLSENGVALCRQDVRVSQGGVTVAAIDPLALQSPLVDHLNLLSGLSGDGQAKFLRTLLTTGPSLFKQGMKSGGSLDGFEKIIGQLLSSLSMARLPLQSFRALGEKARLLSYTLPMGHDAPEISDLVQVIAGRVQRIRGFTVTTHVGAKATTLHLVLPEPLAPDATLIGISDAPLSLAGPAQGEELRPLQPWLQQQAAPLKTHLLGTLKTLRTSDAIANNLYEEMKCPESDQPQLEILQSSCCDKGLLYAVKVQDSRGLLSNARWVCGDTEMEVPLDRPVWHPVHGDIHVGYVRGFDVDPDDALPGVFELWGVMRSRRAFRAQSVQPDRFCGRVPSVFEPLENQSVEKMLGQAVADAIGCRRAPNFTVDWFGTRPAKTEISLVIFVDGTIDYPRALLTLLAQEPHRGASVSILVGSDPSKRSGLRHLAENLHAVTSCTIAVLCLDGQDALPSECLRAALSQQDAVATIVFHREFLPQGSGWLDRWRGLVSPGEDARIASIPLDGHPHAPPIMGGCRILNQHAVETFRKLPLGASSLEAELTRYERIAGVAVPHDHTAICYGKLPLTNAVQSRADAEAIAYLDTKAA